MASEFYGYFDSVAGDEREYDAAQFSQVLRAAMRNGISSHNDGGLAVTAAGGSMNSVVSPGGCLINGYVYVLSDDGGAVKSFTHDASAASDRIDRIVVRLEMMSDARKISLKRLVGAPGASPAAPTLTRTDSVYELALAQVRIRAGAESVEAGDVTDERGDESVCGYAVPTRLSEAALNARYAGRGVATASADGLMSAADKTAHDAVVQEALRAADVVNNLTTTTAGKALDARQGKALNDSKATTARYTATLTVAGWSASAPYTQAVTVTGILATDTPMADVVLSATAATAKNQLEAWGCVGRIVTAANQITAYCYEDKPTAAIPIQLKVVR